MIIDSSFTSAADMAKTIYPFIPSFLLGTKLDSAAKVRAVTIPKLFIHSRADEIVPFRLGERLYQAAAQPKEFLELPKGADIMTFRQTRRKRWPGRSSLFCAGTMSSVNRGPRRMNKF